MAAFFWIGLGADSNWGTVNNWSATSGGVTNAATPSSTSDVTFDGVGVSGNTSSTIAASVTILSLTFASGYTQTVTINTTRVLTIAGNFTDNTAHSWTVSGTGAMTISAASTITSGGKTFPGPVTFSGANTKTLSGDWTISGTLTISSTTTITSNTLTVAGLTVNGTTSGTTAISMSGGTWSGNGSVLSNNLTIAGNVTVSGGNSSFSTGTLTYSSGTVTTTGSTLTLGPNSTLNTNGITWNNIIFNAAATITINSLLTATGTMTINAGIAITFAGTAGFTTATFSCLHSTAIAITLKNSVTYTITTAFNAFSSRVGAILSFTSDDGTLKAILTLNNGATCNVLASFTRIDASNGRAIWTFNGTVTTCFNIIALTDLSFVTGRPNIIQGNSNY